MISKAQQAKLRLLEEASNPGAYLTRLLTEKAQADAVFSMYKMHGEDGATPEKGVDYFTQEEIDAFTEKVRALVKEGIDGKDGVDGVDGVDGQDGQDGEDGYTPIYGIDYFTEQERQRMIKDVLKDVKVKDGVSPNIDDIVQKVVLAIPDKKVSLKDITDINDLVSYLKLGGFRGGGGSGGGGTTSPLTTKGDLYTYSTANARLPVGTDGQLLSADSTQTTGLKWITASGTGTVTAVSVTTANGVSGVVANPNTTPAITFTLGAITPSSVAAVGTVTGSNLSGTNTGDQTSVTGNAGTATALQTTRTIGTATGDVTSAGSAFDGTANNTNAYTLATVNGNVGSFTNSSITVDGKGRITAASSGAAPVTAVSVVSSNGVSGTSSGGATPALTIQTGATTITVAQTAHGFAVGDVIRSNGTADQYTKAQANSATNAEVAGIVTVVTNANNFTYTTEGVITTGVPTNTAGTVYFLDPSSAGAITATKPTTSGQVIKPVLIVLNSATRAQFSFSYTGTLISTVTLPDVVSVGITIDGSGAAITTGIKGDIYIPYSGTISAVTMLADQSGSIVVDVWKIAYGSYPATVANKITASAPPTITTATKSQDTTLTGWTTSITAGDTIRFNVNSATTITRLNLVLTVTKT